MAEKAEEKERLTAAESDSYPVIHLQPGVEGFKLDVPHVVVHDYMTKSTSLMSISQLKDLRERFRKKREKFLKNQCAGIICLLILGTLLNVLAYLASVWSAQLQAEAVKAALDNEHSLKSKLKKTLTEAPSKYLIGLLNFGGRISSALGIVMLTQVVASYLKRRKYNALMRSAAEEADTLICDVHGGVTDSVGECCLACFQIFNS